MTDNMHSRADSAFAICLINNGKCQTDAAMLWHFHSSTQWHSWHTENEGPPSNFQPPFAKIAQQKQHTDSRYHPEKDQQNEGKQHRCLLTKVFIGDVIGGPFGIATEHLPSATATATVRQKRKKNNGFDMYSTDVVESYPPGRRWYKNCRSKLTSLERRRWRKLWLGFWHKLLRPAAQFYIYL